MTTRWGKADCQTRLHPSSVQSPCYTATFTRRTGTLMSAGDRPNLAAPTFQDAAPRVFQNRFSNLLCSPRRF